MCLPVTMTAAKPTGLLLDEFRVHRADITKPKPSLHSQVQLSMLRSRSKCPHLRTYISTSLRPIILRFVDANCTRTVSPSDIYATLLVKGMLLLLLLRCDLELGRLVPAAQIRLWTNCPHERQVLTSAETDAGTRTTRPN